jgi:anti-sigma factor RsiW
MPTDGIEQVEIEAYIDGELDLARRLAVEDHLARHPALAARVMADFRTRSALQLLMGADPAISRSLASAVAKVRSQGRSVWRRPVLGAATVAVAGILAVFGLQGTEPPPAYVGVAVASHRSIMDRAAHMLGAPVSDHAQTLLSASRITVPTLPGDWRVTDVQLLATKKGPAMLIAVRTTEGRDLSIFAIRGRSSASRSPDAVRDGLQSVAYWRVGDISYALTGEEDPEQIDATAKALTNLWRA